MSTFVNNNDKKLMQIAQNHVSMQGNSKNNNVSVDNAEESDCLYISGNFSKENYVPGIFFDFECYVNDFVILPSVRQTRYARKVRSDMATPEVKKAKRYNENKSKLASIFAWTGVGEITQYPVALSFVIGFTNAKRRCMDADNLQKAILDALQKSNVIAQDNVKHVCGTDITRVFQSDKDFVWVGLRSISFL